VEISSEIYQLTSAAGSARDEDAASDRRDSILVDSDCFCPGHGSAAGEQYRQQK
jgi:hypothetical protein